MLVWSVFFIFGGGGRRRRRELRDVSVWVVWGTQVEYMKRRINICRQRAQVRDVRAVFQGC